MVTPVGSLPPVERPGARGLSPRWQKVLASLKQQPGVWHVIHVSDRPSSVGGPLRAHGVRLARRKIDGQHFTFANWEPF